MSEEKTIRTNARAPIKVSEDNRETLRERLDMCQKNAMERLVYAPEIIGAAMMLEMHLEKLAVPKKERVGTLAMWSPFAGNVPRSYKFTPQGTVVFFQRRATGWYVTDIKRDRVGFPTPYGKGTQPKFTFVFPIEVSDRIKNDALFAAQFPEAI